MPESEPPPDVLSVEHLRTIYKVTPGDKRTVKTPERLHDLFEALTQGASRLGSARHIGISEATMWRWLRDDDVFKSLCEEAESRAEVSLVRVIFQAAAAGTWQAAAWWLERRLPQVYGRKDKLDVTTDARALAESIAAAEGWDVNVLMAEAERILTVHQRVSVAAVAAGAGDLEPRAE